MSAAISGGMPGPSSITSTCKRHRATRPVRAAQAQRHVVEGVQPDGAAALRLGRLGGVLDQVQEHLQQLVRIGQVAGSEGS